jgi:hypothetical protein
VRGSELNRRKNYRFTVNIEDKHEILDSPEEDEEERKDT